MTTPSEGGSKRIPWMPAAYGALGGYIVCFLCAARWMQDCWEISPWVSFPAFMAAGAYTTHHFSQPLKERIHPLDSTLFNGDVNEAYIRFSPHLGRANEAERREILNARTAHANQLLSEPGKLSTWTIQRDDLHVLTAILGKPHFLSRSSRGRVSMKPKKTGELSGSGYDHRYVDRSTDSKNKLFIFHLSAAVFLNGSGQLVAADHQNPADEIPLTVYDDFLKALSNPRSVTYSCIQGGQRKLVCIQRDPSLTNGFIVNLDAYDEKGFCLTERLSKPVRNQGRMEEDSTLFTPKNPHEPILASWRNPDTSPLGGCFLTENDMDEPLVIFWESKSFNAENISGLKDPMRIVSLWKPGTGECRSLMVTNVDHLMPCPPWNGTASILLQGKYPQTLSIDHLWSVAGGVTEDAESSRSVLDENRQPLHVLQTKLHPTFGMNPIQTVAPLQLPNNHTVLAVAQGHGGVALYDCEAGKRLYSITWVPDESHRESSRFIQFVNDNIPGPHRRTLKAKELAWATDDKGYPALLIQQSDSYWNPVIWQSSWSEHFPSLHHPNRETHPEIID